jgi:hypothetical protein
MAHGHFAELLKLNHGPRSSAQPGLACPLHPAVLRFARSD